MLDVRPDPASSGRMRKSDPSGVAGLGAEPTIHDVALAAGVSIRTVSRVLNKSTKVNHDTRARIETAIRALDFKPSARARALALGRSLLIGMVHNERNALVLDSVQRGIIGEAAARGYELIMHPVPMEQVDAAADILAFGRRSRVDGIVVLAPVSGVAGLAGALLAEGLPAVAVSAVPLDGFASVVVSRERAAAAMVAHYLAGQGHRRIAMITGPRDAISAQERRAGFLQALEERGIACAVEVEGDYGFQSGVVAGLEVLGLERRPTAIFAGNDIMAAGVLKAAAARGVRVPAELSVIGFDGSPLAEMLTPALTTVARPVGRMAAEATRRLLDLVEGRPAMPEPEPELALLMGESCGPAAA